MAMLPGYIGIAGMFRAGLALPGDHVSGSFGYLRHGLIDEMWKSWNQGA
jgi:hypothetical protein